MTDEQKSLLLKWVEKYEPYPVAPVPWWEPPLYVKKTITKRIEPYATEYDALWQTHPDYWACPDCGGQPDPEFYAPTRKLIALDRKLDRLRPKAFMQVPNPDYDEERAEAWKAARRPQFAKTITVGDATAPDAL